MDAVESSLKAPKQLKNYDYIYKTDDWFTTTVEHRWQIHNNSRAQMTDSQWRSSQLLTSPTCPQRSGWNCLRPKFCRWSQHSPSGTGRRSHYPAFPLERTCSEAPKTGPLGWTWGCAQTARCHRGSVDQSAERQEKWCQKRCSLNWPGEDKSRLKWHHNGSAYHGQFSWSHFFSLVSQCWY